MCLPCRKPTSVTATKSDSGAAGLRVSSLSLTYPCSQAWNVLQQLDQRHQTLLLIDLTKKKKTQEDQQKQSHSQRHRRRSFFSLPSHLILVSLSLQLSPSNHNNHHCSVSTLELGLSPNKFLARVKFFLTPALSWTLTQRKGHEGVLTLGDDPLWGSRRH